MKGISTNLTTLVAYFFVRQLKAEDLVKLIEAILNKIEQIGFKVIRLVADDFSVNQKAFKILSGGELANPQIENPANPARPLFLSYDYCHVFKNLRNNFLNRNLSNSGEKIDSGFLVKLMEKQENCSSSLSEPYPEKC